MDNLTKNKKNTAADKLSARLVMCECSMYMRSKHFLNHSWAEVEQNLMGTQQLWSSFPVELQARLIASKGVFQLRDVLYTIDQEQEARGEKKYQAGPGACGTMVGLFTALSEFFELSGAVNEEATEFDGNELDFTGLLARMLDHCAQQDDADEEAVMLDLEEAMANADQDASGAVCSKEGLALRKDFEDSDVCHMCSHDFNSEIQARQSTSFVSGVLFGVRFSEQVQVAAVAAAGWPSGRSSKAAAIMGLIGSPI